MFLLENLKLPLCPTLLIYLLDSDDVNIRTSILTVKHPKI